MLYYHGIFWNDYPKVQKYLNRLATGNSEIFWADYIKKYCNEKGFFNALIPNCGNGHIDRMLLKKNIIRKSVGTDWSEDLLAEAFQIAKAENLPLEYIKLHCNTAFFPDQEFDLIVNHAACHHMQYLYKNIYKFYQILKKSNGLFINYDYVGPHRNQYSVLAWEKIGILISNYLLVLKLTY